MAGHFQIAAVMLSILCLTERWYPVMQTNRKHVPNVYRPHIKGDCFPISWVGLAPLVKGRKSSGTEASLRRMQFYL